MTNGTNTKNFLTGMKNKITWIILAIFAAGLLFLLMAKSIDEDSWICTEKGWIEHGKPNSPKPTTICSKIEKEQLVEKYLRDNISALSTKKEVLGGKFYITKLIWIGDNSGIIEYEDGHIVLKATFDFEIKTNELNNDYSVVIYNFKIIE
jgi:hypothetical protein